MIDARLRARLRLAKALMTCIPASSLAPFELPTWEWRELQATTYRLQLARNRRWQGASQSLTGDLLRCCETLVIRLRGRAVSLSTAPPAEISLRDILADIQGLEEEFPQVKWDLRAKSLSVTTDDIVLDDVSLGPFEITLNFGQLNRTKPYHVIARDPHPAAGDPSTTHPHVKHDDLCEGNGRAAIRRALTQGRFLDLVVLVRQILKTYNAESAFVPLSLWEGAQCSDCGTSVSEEEMTYCETCRSEACSGCGSTCSSCDRSLCYGCQDRCGACEAPQCSSCLQRCSKCAADYCAACLENGRCEDCRETSPDVENDTETDDQTSACIAI